MNEILLSYLAGIVDGEGYIGIKKSQFQKECLSPTYHERLTVCISEKSILNIFKKQFGGYIYKRIFHNKIIQTHKPGYFWEITNRKASETIKILLPYLRIKRKQANLLLKLTESKQKGIKRTKDKLIEPTITQYRDSLYRQIKTIHGNHH